MRTTVDIPDAQYVALRTMAAERGIRGFSPLISAAIDLLLTQEDEARVDEALALAGTLSADEADVLEQNVADLRTRTGRSGHGVA